MSDSKLVEVVALQRGHDGSEVRTEGEKFLVDESRLNDGSTWFVPVGSEEAAAAKPEPATGAGRGKK